METLFTDAFLSALKWFPFVLALGLTYRHLKVIDVSVDGVVVVAGIAAAFAWDASGGSYLASFLAAGAVGIASGLLMGFIVHGLRIDPLLSGILLAFALHALSVILVGESMPLEDTRLAGSLSSYFWSLVGFALVLGVGAVWFYRTNFGTLVRALGSNPSIRSPLRPGLVLTAGFAISGLVAGLGAGLYVHAEGTARAGGGFEFLLTGLTSFLAVERPAQALRAKVAPLVAHVSSRRGRRFARVSMDALTSVPVLAFFGTIAFQLLLYAVMRQSPETWRLLLALVLVLSLGNFRLGKLLRPKALARQIKVFVRRFTHEPSIEGARTLKVSGLTRTFHNSNPPREILKGLSFEVSTGLTVVSGSNGVGKTTLLRCLAGDSVVDAGMVRVNGVDVQAMPPNRKSIFRIAQDPADNLAGDLTVSENLVWIALGASRPFGLSTTRSARYVLDALASTDGAPPLNQLFGSDFLRRKASDLSGGEAQWVSLVLALLSNADVVLADEPTANLDDENHLRVCDVLESVATRRVVLAVTHDRRLRSHATANLKLEAGTARLLPLPGMEITG